MTFAIKVLAAGDEELQQPSGSCTDSIDILNRLHAA